MAESSSHDIQPVKHTELPKQQTVAGLFDQVVDRWRGGGPALGHLAAIRKGESRKLLSLVKKSFPGPEQGSAARYTLGIQDAQTDRREELELTTDGRGNQTSVYRIFSDMSPQPIEIKLGPEEFERLNQRIITQSRWGREKTFNPYGYLDMEQVPPEDILRELGLMDFRLPHETSVSVQKSEWFRIDGGRVMVEIRNPALLKQERKGTVYVSDADDTIFSATGWHGREFESFSQNDALAKRGIAISASRAKEIYELSKIMIPGKAEQERRYTPRLNIALLSLYGRALEAGKPDIQAFDDMMQRLEELKVQSNREAEINKMALDPDILNVLSENHLSDFLYQDYVDDIFAGTEHEDLRIIATRGTIEGPLGQVHKMHQTGILDIQQSSHVRQDDESRDMQEFKPADIVIYTNDLKAETLTLIPQLFPYLADRTLRIYDDNPSELKQYYDWAKEHSLHNLEMIQVRHSGAKRRDARVDVAVPAVRTGTEEDEIKPVREPLPQTASTIYDVYLPYPDRGTHAVI